MKNFLNLSLIMIIIQALLCSQAMASSRVDDILTTDRETQVRRISNELHDLEAVKNTLVNLEQHLRKTRKGQSIYLKLETIAGAVIVVGAVIGSYKFYFPPGFRAMASAYITATALSRGLIKLSDKEVANFLVKIVILNNDIRKLEEKLNEQKTATCNELQYYMLCSY